MFNKIRPLIFKFSPEVAHSLAIKTLKLNALPKKKIKNKTVLETSIFNKILENPIGVAAGFDKNAEVYNPEKSRFLQNKKFVSFNLVDDA